jgi:hypothetical protein
MEKSFKTNTKLVVKCSCVKQVRVTDKAFNADTIIIYQCIQDFIMSQDIFIT